MILIIFVPLDQLDGDNMFFHALDVMIVFVLNEIDSGFYGALTFLPLDAWYLMFSGERLDL
jgi:hypothetical protein